MTTPQAVIKSARKLIGTPYHHQGRCPGHACDCIGLPILVCKDLGLGDFDTRDYGRQPDLTFQRRIESICQPVALQPGALILFRINKQPQHCGIVANDGHELQLIHAWELPKKVVQHYLGAWEKKIIQTYALPGVDYSANY